MRKKGLSVFVLLLSIAAGMFSGCGKTDAGVKEDIVINIAALKGPTAMGMVKMMEDDADGKSAYDYEFTVAGAADEITAGIVKGEYQIAAVPANLACTLYNKTSGGVKAAAINTLGVLYIVQNKEMVSDIKDLKGKKIYSTGKGTTPEYTLNELLLSAGIDPENDVEIEFLSEATEAAALLSESDKDIIAMLPQPYVTTVMMNNKNVSVALDVTAEWEKLKKDSTVVTGVVLVNSKFAEEHPQTLADFLDEYRASVAYSVNETDSAAELVEKYGIIKAAVAKNAMPMCNMVFIEGDDMKAKLTSYLQVLFDQNPNSIGGKMPGEDFFHEGTN